MWRNQANHKEETKAVKAALQRAGFDVRAVGHGTGTAWAWLEIEVASPLHAACENHGSISTEPFCSGCRVYFDALTAQRNEVIRVAQAVTGRHGEYSGDILVRHGGWS